MNPIHETYLDMARAFESAGKFGQALTWYQKIEGNPDVYETIGEYYYLGRGCGKDKVSAKRFFQRAAEFGNIDALCNLALCEESYDLKHTYYSKAAENGSAYAMNMLGIILEDMKPEAIGSNEVIQWYKKAADMGSAIGCYNYAINVADAEVKIRYLEKAVAMDCVIAMEKYMAYLNKGQYCKRDPKKAEAIKKRIEQTKK